MKPKLVDELNLLSMKSDVSGALASLYGILKNQWSSIFDLDFLFHFS